MAEKQVYVQQDNMQPAPPPPYQQKYESTNTTTNNNMTTHNQSNLPTNTVALFPQYVSSTPQTLKMRGEIMSSTWTITTSTNPTPILTLESEGLFTSKMSFLDTRTNQTLFTLQRTKFSFKDHYYAPSPSGREGETLLEVTKETKFLGKGKLTIEFQNPTDGRMVQLDLQSHSFSSDCEVFCAGRVVARITAKMMSMHGEYNLAVEAGVDPVLIVVLVYVVADMEKRRSSAAAGASGGGGSGC